MEGWTWRELARGPVNGHEEVVFVVGVGRIAVRLQAAVPVVATEYPWPWLERLALHLQLPSPVAALQAWLPIPHPA
jgi:hypothetical protein